MQSLPLTFLNIIKQALIGGVLLVAIVLGSIQLLAPVISGQQYLVSEAIYDYTGQTVQFDNFTLNVSGIHAQAQMRDFRLHSKEGAPMIFDKVNVSLNIARSLWNMSPKFDYILISGARISVNRKSDGNWYLSAFRLPEPELDPVLPDWVTGQRTFAFLDAEILFSDEQKGITQQRFSNVQFIANHRNSETILKLSASMPENIGRRLQLSVSIPELNRKIKQNNFNIYAKFGRVKPNSVFSRYLKQLTAWKEGVADVQLWVDVAEQGLSDLQLGMGVSNLKVEQVVKDQTQRLNLDDGELFVRYLPKEEGDIIQWRSENLVSESAYLQLPDGMMEVTAAENEINVKGQLLKGETSYHPAMEDWLRIIAPDNHFELAKYNPSFAFEQLVFSAKKNEQQWVDWRVQGDLHNLYSNPVGKLPGFKGLSAEILLTRESAMASVDSTNLTIDFAELFRDPLYFRTLEGNLYWKDNGKRSYAWSGDLFAGNEDLETVSKFRYEFPLNETKGYLQLWTDFKEGTVKATGRYLPTSIMSNKVVAWLDEALQDGKLTSGSLRYTGNLSGFPYRDHSGVFQVAFNVDQSKLKFHKDWPALQDFNGDLLFDDYHFSANINRGVLFDSNVDYGRITIDELNRAVVMVDGKLSGELPDLLRALSETSLRKDYSAYTKGLQSNGKASVTFSIRLPVSSKVAELPASNGVISFKGNEIFSDQWGARLQNIDGDLKFTNTGLEADHIAATFLGRPIKIDIRPLAGKAGSHITATGLFGIQDLFTDVSPEITDMVEGRSEWIADLQIRQDETQHVAVEVSAATDLSGVYLDLPHPMKKDKADKVPFEMQTSFVDGQLQPVYLKYDSLVSSALDIRQQAIHRAGLHYQTDQWITLPEKGVYISGQLPTIDPMQWLKWQPDVIETGREWLATKEVVVDLMLDELPLYGQKFRDIHLQARQIENGWDMNVESDQVKGDVLYQVEKIYKHNIALDLEYLKLEYDSDEASDAFDKLDVASMPIVKVDADKLFVNEYELGKFFIQAHPEENILIIDALRVESEKTQFNADGAWYSSKEGQDSELRAHLQTDELARLLAGLGHEEVVKADHLTLDFNGSWGGSPSDFDEENLEGTLYLMMKDGRFADIDPGAGRMLGLMSLQSIPRRLKLDFSDLFSKGYSFDRVEGHFDLLDGDAYTGNLTMDGPAAKIEISGRIGMVTKDYDQMLVVTPRVSSSLPLAGTMVGGPGVGAVLLLTNQLFKRQLEDMTRYRYSLTGTWEEPVLERMK